MNPESTHHRTISFGKHRGELFTRLPLGYLRWMVNEGTQQAEIAHAELQRRGDTMPLVELSGHAIDKASLRCRKIWHQTRKEGEGLWSWLQRMTLEAIEQGAVTGDRIHYKGMKFCVMQGDEIPVLKTIMRNKAVAEDPDEYEPE